MIIPRQMMFLLIIMTSTGLYLVCGVVTNRDNTLYANAQFPNTGTDSSDDNNTSLAVSTVCRGNEPCQSLVCNNNEPCYVSKSVNPGGFNDFLDESEDSMDDLGDSLDDLKE
jgi:hypothetical protein